MVNAAANAIVQRTLETLVDDRGEIGIQVSAYLKGELAVDAWAGLADETTGRLVDGNTLFPAWSTTKAIAATAVHVQAEKGLIDYMDPIADYWPEFGCHGKEKATVYDALTHRLGIPLMPADVTPELMCNWEWMVSKFAEMAPLFEPGTKTAYHSLSFGWVLGEIVCRTDPKNRRFGDFVQEEICQPLGIDSMWIGIPDEAEPRVAKLTDLPEGVRLISSPRPGLLFPLAVPAQIPTTQAVFGRPDVRRACIPAANGIMNSRSLARFFAMMAGGGQFDGVRLLSEHRVRTFSVPRPPCDYDLTLGTPQPASIAGFHLSCGRGSLPMAAAGTNPQIFGEAGFGGQVAWADPTQRLAVAILHNRMVRSETADPEENPIVYVGNAVREGLGLPEYQG